MSPNHQDKMIKAKIRDILTTIIAQGWSTGNTFVLRREYITPSFLMVWLHHNHDVPKLKYFLTSSGPVSIEVVSTVNQLSNEKLCEIRSLSCGSYYVIPLNEISKHVNNMYVYPATKTLFWLYKNHNMLWATNLLALIDGGIDEIMKRKKEFADDKIKSYRDVKSAIAPIEAVIGRTLLVL